MDSSNLPTALSFEPPDNWLRLVTLESHTAGEPFRIVVSGFPKLSGRTIVALRREARERYDFLRTALMWEPRGHADMYGAVITEPERADSAFGILFLHNEGFSTMCGHGVLAMAKVAVQTRMVPVVEPETLVRMDTPAGQVVATVRVKDGQACETRFTNVPSFVVGLDRQIEVPGLGAVDYDLAYGGAFYAYVEAESLGLRCDPSGLADMLPAAASIKAAVAEQDPVRHPFSPDLSLLYGVVFCAPSDSSEVHSRNVCVFADGEVDRSPTGTSVSARLAILHRRGELALQREVGFESILGTRFHGRVLTETTFGDHQAIVPEVSGEAYLTGRSEWWIDPEDPLGAGFLVR